MIVGKKKTTSTKHALQIQILSGDGMMTKAD
jgi:hypothetical protein